MSCGWSTKYWHKGWKKKTFQIFTCKTSVKTMYHFSSRPHNFFSILYNPGESRKVLGWRNVKKAFWRINTFVRYCQLLRKNKTWWQCPLVAGLSKWNLYSGTGHKTFHHLSNMPYWNTSTQIHFQSISQKQAYCIYQLLRPPFWKCVIGEQDLKRQLSSSNSALRERCFFPWE